MSLSPAKTVPLFVLFLMLLPHPASAMSTPTAGERAELAGLAGLKTLFTRLRNSIEACFEADAQPHTLLRSNDAYLHSLPRSKQQRWRTGYVQSIGYWKQFQEVASRVLSNDAETLTCSRAYDAFVSGESVLVSALAGFRARDRFVHRMMLLGYAPHEISDVITGRITLYALRKADRMIALGYGREAIASYLERHYRRVSSRSAVNPRDGKALASLPDRGVRGGNAKQPTPEMLSERERLDRHVVRYARGYGIDPNLVRAIIANESSWRPRVRSPAGAIGLMQLMPATAERLGVDPLDPVQNIEGGVRYLAALMDIFDGELDTVLVGYNAGPTYARKWRKGAAALYGETRDYLQRVKHSYMNPKL